MRAVPLCATIAALAATLHLSAQQPAGGSQAKPRTPARPAPTPPRPAAPAPQKDAAVPFRVGETLTYDVAWSTYLIAGSATSRVVEKRAAAARTPSAYYIVA